MPVTKSAIKKLRHDRAKTLHNDVMRAKLHDTMRQVRKKIISLPEAYAVVDKSTKLNLIHPNKAARLKSKIAHELPLSSKKTTPKVAKSPSKPRTAPTA